jgi:hypothetical protein
MRKGGEAGSSGIKSECARSVGEWMMTNGVMTMCLAGYGGDGMRKGGEAGSSGIKSGCARCEDVRTPTFPPIARILGFKNACASEKLKIVIIS